jgi:hypothetical protein
MNPLADPWPPPSGLSLAGHCAFWTRQLTLVIGRTLRGSGRVMPQADPAVLPLEGGGAYRVVGADRPCLPSVMLEVEIPAATWAEAADWVRDYREFGRGLFRAFARDYLPAHLGWAVRLTVRVGASVRHFDDARLGVMHLGGAMVFEEGPVQDLPLIEEIVKLVGEICQPRAPYWQEELRKRLRELTARGEFRDGELLTADRLNALIRRLEKVEADVGKIQSQPAAAPPPTRRPDGGYI